MFEKSSVNAGNIVESSDLFRRETYQQNRACIQKTLCQSFYLQDKSVVEKTREILANNIQVWIQ